MLVTENPNQWDLNNNVDLLAHATESQRTIPHRIVMHVLVEIVLHSGFIPSWNITHSHKDA